MVRAFFFFFMDHLLCARLNCVLNVFHGSFQIIIRPPSGYIRVEYTYYFRFTEGETEPQRS